MLNGPKSPNLGNPPAGTEIENSNNTSLTEYKRLSSPKYYLCICPLCNTVGLDWIVEQYTNYHNILIEDRNSQLIYDPFGRELVK